MTGCDRSCEAGFRTRPGRRAGDPVNPTGGGAPRTRQAGARADKYGTSDGGGSQAWCQDHRQAGERAIDILELSPRETPSIPGNSGWRASAHLQMTRARQAATIGALRANWMASPPPRPGAAQHFACQRLVSQPDRLDEVKIRHLEKSQPPGSFGAAPASLEIAEQQAAATDFQCASARLARLPTLRRRLPTPLYVCTDARFFYCGSEQE